MVRVLQFAASVLPNVKAVVMRFPVSVLLAGMLSAILLYGAFYRTAFDFYGFALLTMFFASVGAVFYGERQGWHSLNRVLLALGVCAFLGSLFLLPLNLQLTPYMMPLALLLLAGTAAYTERGPVNGRYWQFIHSYWFVLLVAILGGLLIAGLASLLIGAFGLLFQTSVASKIYEYAFIISLCFIAPLIWLSLLPDRFDVEVVDGDSEDLPAKITALFVRYVFVPFFLLFALLFLGLGGKVLSAGVLPPGQVAMYGTVVIVTGILTYLLAYPTRLSGGPLVMFFHKNWMWFLLVPLVLVGFALQERLAAYGMTPLRYYMFGFLFWAALVVAYGLYTGVFDKVFDLRVVGLLAGGVIGLASFGPWGAEAVSNVWQKQRLEAALTRLGVMEEGVIVQAFAQNREGLSGDYGVVREGMRYFRGKQRGRHLRSFLPKNIDLTPVKKIKKSRWPLTESAFVLDQVKGMLGPLPGEGKGADVGGWVRYSVPRPFAVSLPGKGRLYGPFQINLQPTADQTKPNTAKAGLAAVRHYTVRALERDVVFAVRVGEGQLRFQHEGKDVGRFLLQDLQGFAKRHQRFLKSKIGLTGDMGEDAIKSVGDGGSHLMLQTIAYRLPEQKDALLSLDDTTCWLFIEE